MTAASSNVTLVNDALRILRDRGRLIIVGDVPLHLDRGLMYQGELTVQVSRSYGPGRYDFNYEERARDYPIGQVRWTEGRNLAAVIDLIQSGRLDVAPLITAIIPIAEARRAYELASDRDAHLAVLVSYDSVTSVTEPRVSAPLPPRSISRTHRPTRGSADRSRRLCHIRAGSGSSCDHRVYGAIRCGAAAGRCSQWSPAPVSSPQHR